MNCLRLHGLHEHLGARFRRVMGAEVVNDYGDWQAEHAALRQTAGVLDLSFRSRLCLTGDGRARFLHGQVANDVRSLQVGEGLYTIIANDEGRLMADLNLFCLAQELLLDLEPGLTGVILRRLRENILGAKVQVVDVAPHYGLLSVQGPRAYAVLRAVGLAGQIPMQPLACVQIADPELGEIQLTNHARLMNRVPVEPPNVVFSKGGFDLFVPNHSLPALADRLIAVVKQHGGRFCGWEAFETARIEAGIPRFGVDMDDTNHPLECRLESRGVVFKKGCYVGREAINRVRVLDLVGRQLRGLMLAEELPALPQRGDKLYYAGGEIGHITSAVRSPWLQANIGFGYVQRGVHLPGTHLTFSPDGAMPGVTIAELPFNVDLA